MYIFDPDHLYLYMGMIVYTWLYYYVYIISRMMCPFSLSHTPFHHT